ncbi:AAA-type ATPase family protein [Actinidia rufa]|uniref:AAA-type ATPase family protein n=1 Tax=Actinidia rufa TaxID=165716 RepID=A0A7J0G122_9ERIC|nr:AAA-type ATPase family protein [Actinidia rufa]
MSTTVHRTTKSGRQSLFFHDLASPVSTRRGGGGKFTRITTPGQAAAVSALWRENFATSDLPPPPVFTLEDRSDLSPESGIPDYLVSPEIKSDPRTPAQSSGQEFSTPKSKAEASTSFALMGGKQQNQQSPVANLSWWSPGKSGGRGEQDEKGNGSPVEGVVHTGALITLPPPREVARPEIQRNSLPAGSLDEEEWVTVYGHGFEVAYRDQSEVKHTLLEEQLLSSHHQDISVGIGCSWPASRGVALSLALKEPLQQINGVLIVGAKPVDPGQRQFLNDRVNNQGFMPLPLAPLGKSSESNPLSTFPRPYYFQDGNKSARPSAGGILLCGPPGVGKTLFAKAVAGEVGVNFFSISASQFVEIYVGVGASHVRALYQEAKEMAPSVVFIDELDAVGRERGLIKGSGGQECDATLNQLLVCLDGFEGRGEVITIASTNRPDILDPALVRPGRFDRKIYIPKLGLIGREEILKVHARKKPMAEDVDYVAVASVTNGMVGADLANIIEVAAINMMLDGRTELWVDGPWQRDLLGSRLQEVQIIMVRSRNLN